MLNIVSLASDRPRPQRALDVPRGGARILFFTGVRYCREDDSELDEVGADDREPVCKPVLSDRRLDAAAH